MKQVFISYSSQEAQQANEIVEALEKQGIECWIAPRNLGISTDYTRVLPSAIEEHPFFLLVLSSHAQTSQWVKRELLYALNLNKNIIPVMIEDCTISKDFSFLLGNVQIGFYYRDKDTAIQTVIDLILSALTPQECFDHGQALYNGGLYEEAFRWNLRAAEHGHAYAQYNLGISYANGTGVPLSHETAVEWYRKAAGQKHSDAQYCLGLCYANGWGVAQNYKTAAEWYRKAADQGHEDAQKALEELQ